MPIWSATSAYSPRGGNSLDIYIDGEDAFAAIYDALAQAQTSIYATFAYIDFDFRLRPENPISLLKLLQERAAAGVDVRILIWDPVTRIPGTIRDPGNTPLAGINAGAKTVQARWDRPSWGGLWLFGCHHQKSFVIDGRIGFVGGINSTQSYWDTRQHDPLDIRRVPFSILREQAPAQVSQYLPLHDLFTRIQGPAVDDVEANFAERWNGATFKHLPATQDLDRQDTPTPMGNLDVQILRTIPKKQYAATAHGERSILDWYINAINAAQKFIYFENQYFYDHRVSEALEKAIDRGVIVVGLMARRPDQGQLQGYFETAKEFIGNVSLILRRLIRRSRVELYCPIIARPDPAQAGKFIFEDIYVHAKVLIVDDACFTIGSANISTFSMRFHSELNVAVNDAKMALELRRSLWQEHFQEGAFPDADLLNDRHGFHLWREAAQQNVAAYNNGAQPKTRIFPWNFRVGRAL